MESGPLLLSVLWGPLPRLRASGIDCDWGGWVVLLFPNGGVHLTFQQGPPRQDSETPSKHQVLVLAVVLACVRLREAWACHHTLPDM